MGADAASRNPSSRALVLAGGGVTGIAWELGVLHGLAGGGVDLRDADLVIGTSAGSAVGAQVCSGAPLTDLYARQRSEDHQEIPAEFDLEQMMEAFADLFGPAAGTDEVRVFTGGYSRVATSPVVNVTAPPPPPPVQLTPNVTTATAGSPVTVTLTNGPGGPTDWIALAASGAANNNYLQWVYVGSGVTSRDWTVTMPAAAGTYEFRLFLNNGYTRAATSAAITVTP